MRYALIGFQKQNTTADQQKQQLETLFRASGMGYTEMVIGDANTTEAYLKAHQEPQLNLPFEK